MMIGVLDGRVWQKRTRCLCLWHDTPQLVVLEVNLEGGSCRSCEQSYTILAKRVGLGDDEY